MGRVGLSVTPAIAWVLALTAFGQVAWLLWVAEGADSLLVAAAIGAGVLSFAWGTIGVHRALAPLWLEALRLQDMAIGWGERALDTQAGAGSDRALGELAQLREHLAAQLRADSQATGLREQQSEQKASFLRSVRHELRTPLNAVLGLSDALLDEVDGPLGQSQRESLTVIATTARRLSMLVDDVLELSAQALGETAAGREPIDLALLLDQVAEDMQAELGAPVHVRTQVEPGLVHALGDPERVRRLVQSMARHTLALCRGELLLLRAERASAHEVRIDVLDPRRVLEHDELAVLLGERPSQLRRRGVDESTRLRMRMFELLAAHLRGSFALRSDEAGTCLSLRLPCQRTERAERSEAVVQP